MAEDGKAWDPRRSVQNSILYLEQNYASVLSVQSLADAARLPRWQYLRVFKQLTGNTPSGYLTYLRMEKAKQLLRQPEGKVWEIGLQVGYRDEQYFYRRFKQVTGIAPGEYARLNRIALQVTDWRGNRCNVPLASRRIIYDDASTLGDLLVLGISPVGANIRCYPVTEQLQETKEIGFPLELDKVRALQPDLVLLSRYGYEHAEPISEMAPIVGLNEYAPMERRMLKLGEILDLRDEAQRWLHAYSERREAIWHKLRSRIEPGETAAVLYYTDNGDLYLLHRRRGLAKILYHPLGFRMSEKHGQLRPQRGSYYISLDPKRLAVLLHADRLFVFYRSSLSEAKARNELHRLPDWDGLPAVRAGKVYYLHEQWNGEDALCSEAVLEHFADFWE